MSAGMYLRVLRERQKLTREQLVERIKQDSNESITLSDVSLWSIEDGRQEPKGRLLFALIDALKANFEDISRLILDDSSTVDDARRLAEHRLQLARLTAEADREADRLLSDPRTAEIARRFVEDPEFFAEIAREVAVRARQLRDRQV